MTDEQLEVARLKCEAFVEHLKAGGMRLVCTAEGVFYLYDEQSDIAFSSVHAAVESVYILAGRNPNEHTH